DDDVLRSISLPHAIVGDGRHRWVLVPARLGLLPVHRANCQAKKKYRAQSSHRNAAWCLPWVEAVWMWQMAIARASDASAGWGGSCRCSRRVTIICSRCFSALPYPTPADLIDRGEYSATGRPAEDAASMATPRTCPNLSAVLTLTA